MEMEKNQKMELATLKTQGELIGTEANAFQLTTQRDVDVANAFLKRIATLLKAIEVKRKTFTAPLNQSLKEINSTFKELSGPLAGARTIVTAKIMEWRHKEEKRVQLENERIAREEERRRKIQESHKEKGHEVKEPVTMQRAPSVDDMDSTTTRKTWTFEVVNPLKIPRPYLTVDETAIRQAVKMGARDIPGVRIYQREAVVVR